MPESLSPTSAEAPNSSVAYRIVRGMFVVLFFWVFWKFGGYIVTALVVREFGSGVTSDAYFFATQAVVYGLLFAPALAVLLPAFVPIFIQERNERGEDSAWRFACTVLTLVLLGCAVMLAAAYAFARPVTQTVVRGFDAEAVELGVRLLRWLLPGAALMVVFLLLRAILNSYKVFSYPSAAEAVQKLVWVAVLVATARALGIRGVVLGFLAGSAAMVVVAALGLRRMPGRLRPQVSALGGPRFLRELALGVAFLAGTGLVVWAAVRLLPAGMADYRDLICMTIVLGGVLLYTLQLWVRARGRMGPMARFAVLAVPLVISTFFASYRNVVTYHFQSFTASGVFSDIEGAKKIVNFPTELVALALSVAMLPYLCELASKKDHASLGNIVTNSLRMLAVAFVPLTVMTLVLAEPIVRLVLDRGDRSPEHLLYTARALQILAFPLIVYAAERVIMQAYFSLQRMWTPALLGIASTCFQVAFLLIPIQVLGMSDPRHIFLIVVLAFPVSRLIKNAALLLLLRRHVQVLPWRETTAFAARMAVLCAAVGGVGWLASRGVSGAVPYKPYTQHKVVVATFEPDHESPLPAPAGEVVRLDSEGGGRQPGNALVLPAGGIEWRFDTPLDAAETERFRCRLQSAAAVPRRVTVSVLVPDGAFGKEFVLEPGDWTVLDLAPADLGFGGPHWGWVEGLRVEVDRADGDVHLDDVTFRRPARPMQYAAVMFAHCAVPSLAALAVMLVLLKLLRFRELDQVMQWVKARGWRRQPAEEGETGDGGQ